MNVTKYEVRKYVAGAYDSDGKPRGAGSNSWDENPAFDTLEEATAYFNGLDLKNEWEVEYKTSNGMSNGTLVAEIVECTYEHDDECEDEFVGDIRTIDEKWYSLDEHDAE